MTTFINEYNDVLILIESKQCPKVKTNDSQSKQEGKR
jgi:hypothetical protein